MARVLVVANVSIGLPELTAALDRHALDGDELHLLGPVTPTSAWATVATLGDPGSGAVAPSAALAGSTDEAMHEAEERIRTEIRRLRAAGATVTGEVALSDPFEAAAEAIERGNYDAVIVSTLPSSVSRWLRMDLTSRLKRRSKLPVREITAS